MLRTFSLLLALGGMLFVSCHSHGQYRVNRQTLIYINQATVTALSNTDEASVTLKANQPFSFAALTTKVTVLGAGFKTSFIPLSQVSTLTTLTNLTLPAELSEQGVLYLHTAKAGAINLCRILILTQPSALSVQQQTAILKRAGLSYQIYPEHLSINCKKERS